MAATVKWYTKALVNESGGATSGETPNNDFLSDTIKVALLADTYTPSQHVDTSWSAISSNETTGTGYTAGGATLGSKTLGNTSGVVKYDAADVQWTITGSLTARWGVVYNSTSGQLLGYVDFEANKTVADSTFDIQWDTNGVLKKTAA